LDAAAKLSNDNAKKKVIRYEYDIEQTLVFAAAAAERCEWEGRMDEDGEFRGDKDSK
jgi:hypothetical protein